MHIRAPGHLETGMTDALKVCNYLDAQTHVSCLSIYLY